jgi:8-oxo-dGTP pyrophosphatase MutT (NUDIX family)
LGTNPSRASSRATSSIAAVGARVGFVPNWREEPVSVAPHYGQPELFRIERAATRPFGLMAYGAHLNGFTRRKNREHAWIARRAKSKQVDPGKLDNLVGGRIAAGMSVDETLRKEAWEEAGMKPALLKGLDCIGAVRVEYSVPEGLHREILFVHDLWLAEDFTPENQDGEVSEMKCMPVEDVIAALLAGEFTLDAGVVMIDGLLRLGAVLPEDPSYLDLLRLMKP